MNGEQALQFTYHSTITDDAVVIVVHESQALILI